MKSVFQYELGYGSKVQMPVGAEILTTQFKNDTLQIWALVDPAAPLEYRKFVVCFTEQELSDTEMRYVNTSHDDSIYWHVFEVPWS